MPLESFSEHGLVGLIVGVLLLIVVFFIRFLMADLKRSRDFHRQERKEWREASERALDKFSDVIEKLTVSIDVFHSDFLKKMF